MASTSFPPALALALRQEGGFVDHPADPGGATRFGITRRTLMQARGRAVTVDDVRALGEEEAAAIYRRLYWDAIRADELPPGIDLLSFDVAVHSGPARAASLLQIALGLTVDGRFGPDTIAAACAADPPETIRRLTRLRLDFLSRLTGWPVFGRGWSRRALAVEQAALELAEQASQSLTKDIHMTESKAVFASRTVWVNLVGLTAVALALLGFDTSKLDAGAISDAVLQLIAAASFLASTAFRIAATKQLAR
jgi:lysozyme family protein